jgi:Mannosylglycerate hydrolase MGH1-like glycoside hydrolase domain
VRGNAEQQRLDEDREGTARWKWWGPYLPSRQWGTVREDYSPGGTAWDYFPHDHARSRAYRWGEDGLGGICDRWQHLCFAIALWNGNDPILKERLFGLTNSEGNHGEDVKEYWWALDSTPTHSWMRWLYKYPQRAYPYTDLVAENARRGVGLPEYELVDTGVFDEARYFDIELTYAKAAPEDMCIVIDCTNRGPDPAPLHVLPTLWFRNTWAWGRDDRHPWLQLDGNHVEASHDLFGQRWLAAEGATTASWLFCDNETNFERLYRSPNSTPFPKDGINDHIVQGAGTVNPANSGTKAAAWYRLTIDPGATATVRLRLSPEPLDDPFDASFADTLDTRRAEADDFYEDLASGASSAVRDVQRRALAGLLWAKKHYRYDISAWLQGDPGLPPPPPGRDEGRNAHWPHLYNADIISLPDEWEYPWYAAWDLAFHMVPLALVDSEFAKQQLLLFCREWYMHPNGQMPAYEWAFDDVNPPVHAWAAWRVFKIDAIQRGERDWDFLERIFHKLLMNFSWWVNRKDAEGNNLFEGGFLGLDNIGLFDRSRPLPSGHVLEQSDATSWMAMYCLNMLAIAIELAHHDPTYEDVCTKFFEHFLAIGSAATQRAGYSLWDEDDGFFYDVLVDQTGGRLPLKVRSWVGLIPLFAAETFDHRLIENLPEFRQRAQWFIRKRPEQCHNLHIADFGGARERHFLSLVGPNRLRRILMRMLDETEFLSPHGLRSVSKVHEAEPVRLDLDGEQYEVRYQPGDSDTHLFGGNSNWRGPVWFPLNYLMIEALQKFHHYLGNDFTVEFPTGSGRECTLWEVAGELAHRLTSIFVAGDDGRRPTNGGIDLFDFDAHWKDQVTFNEYFHGDTGRGLGASHQTGWTALVAKLIRQYGG